MAESHCATVLVIKCHSGIHLRREPLYGHCFAKDTRQIAMIHLETAHIIEFSRSEETRLNSSH